MKAYITKYALTVGIMDAEAEQSSVAPSMVTWTYRNGWNKGAAHGEGKDWHRTKEAAVARAEQMRLAKIVSLKKSIKKLESLNFA
jgi:hypothetical protein